jgi:hypothetical protein
MMKMSKVCTKCGIEKDEGEFSLRKDTGNRRNDCKICFNTRTSTWCKLNKDKHNAYGAAYRERNIEKIRAKNRVYARINYDRDHSKKKEYRIRNREKENERQSRYIKERKSKDPLYALSRASRNLLYKAISRKGFKKRSHTADLLGCTFEDFMIRLGNPPCEHPHLDHICPVAQAKTEEEVIKLQNYINFQWLTPEENTSKGDKPTEEGIFLCRFLLGREWIYD